MFKNINEIKNKYNIKPSGDWLTLKQGSNKIRVVSDFVDFGVHSIKEKGKFRSVVCIGKDKGCPYCSKNLPVRVQFLGWVIDRSDGKVKLLKIGWSVYDKLYKLSESEEYGYSDLSSYDIDIIKTGNGLETEYSVIPSRKDVPLTSDELSQIKEVVKDPEEIIEKMKDKVKDLILLDGAGFEELES